VNLRARAAADLARIHADVAGGFGWAITVTNPAGVSAALTGLSTDVETTIDPETGVAVVGRRASVSLVTAQLEALELGEPKGVADRASKPWLVRFNDIGGAAHTFKVTAALPDRAAGCVVCILGVYVP
jgi:hypothetical protein